MGVNTLNNRSSGETITANFFNDIHQAMDGDFVGRNASGVPTSGQNLGTAGIPWGTVRADAFILNGNAVDTSQITSPANRVVSGAVRSVAGSNLPQFIVPDGAALEFDLDATPTNLVLSVNGAAVTFTADQTKTGLTAAPTTNNTALVNDTNAADQFDTKMWGAPEHRTPITMDTVGTEISGLVGKWAAFKIDGVSTEYFMGYVKSATQIDHCFRGFFYNSSLAPIKATAFSNNDMITLMKLTWVFAENDGSTLDVTYTNPVWSFSSPGSPVTGDYWFDMGNNLWKRYDGSAFQTINRTFIGWVIQDGTACVAARCADFYADYKSDNTMPIEKSTVEIAIAQENNVWVNVAGTPLFFGSDLPTWNITTDLAASADMHDATEQASRAYYLYLKKNGDTVMSDIFPYRRNDLKGWYHPYNMWRCVGIAYNDSSSDLSNVGSTEVFSKEWFRADDRNGGGSTATRTARFTTVRNNTVGGLAYVDDATQATRLLCLFPGQYQMEWGSVYAVTHQLVGFELNSTGLTDVSTVWVNNPELMLTFAGYPASGSHNWTGITTYLFLGDIVRPIVETNAVPIAADGENRHYLHFSRTE